MSTAEFCTEAQIGQMVHSFYARVPQDAVLGPVVDAHVADWNAHLETLVDFWSSVLRGTSRFKGASMPKHTALSGLTEELFRRWLMHFHDTAAAQSNQRMARRAEALAQRIAQSLWFGYQIARHPALMPAKLPDG